LSYSSPIFLPVLSSSTPTIINNDASGRERPASKFASVIEAKDDYKNILEVMDKLRVFDADHEFSLPQLVVCGEQSAGKSSVLEAISGVPFPRKGSTCTRFVTQ
jgi:GTP1/Obg family GTP-binding protein